MTESCQALTIEKCGAIFHALSHRHGPAADPERWWKIYCRMNQPPEFERVWSNRLVTQTNWVVVEDAIRNLGRKGLLSASAMADADSNEVARCIERTGLTKQKTASLQAIARYVVNTFGSERDFCERVSRDQLLALPGVGPETADRILLFTCGRWAWPVDSYCLRVFQAHGLLERIPTTARDKRETSVAIKAAVTSALASDVTLGQRFHATMQLEGARLRIARN